MNDAEIKVAVNVELEAADRRVKRQVIYTMRATDDTKEQAKALMHAVFGVFPDAMHQLAEDLKA